MTWQIGDLFLSIKQAFIKYVLCGQHVNLKHGYCSLGDCNTFEKIRHTHKNFKQEEAGIRKDTV